MALRIILHRRACERPTVPASDGAVDKVASWIAWLLSQRSARCLLWDFSLSLFGHPDPSHVGPNDC